MVIAEMSAPGAVTHLPFGIRNILADKTSICQIDTATNVNEERRSQIPTTSESYEIGKSQQNNKRKDDDQSVLLLKSTDEFSNQMTTAVLQLMPTTCSLSCLPGLRYHECYPYQHCIQKCSNKCKYAQDIQTSSHFMSCIPGEEAFNFGTCRCQSKNLQYHSTMLKQSSLKSNYDESVNSISFTETNLSGAEWTKGMQAVTSS